MKFSESWLRQWVDPAISTEELVAQLTMAGLEVEGCEPAAGAFSGVVVGEVLSVEAHPDADKLRVCQVSDGKESFQVVCGAPNVRVGLKVPFATIGAVLGPEFRIKKARLRGVESRGMLCSADELGLSEQADGLLELEGTAVPGQSLRDSLKLDDTIIEVDLTPNRGDCLSIAGLAREVGVLNKAGVDWPEISPVAASIQDSLPVALEASQACPRYLGRVIRNIDPQAATPLWLQEKLRRSGIRSIDPVVDVTNYVLLELGQPMHAFDLDRLSGGIRVRMAADKEKLTLLDGKEVALRPDILVIADHDKVLAMAGIMGGLDSSVTDSTRHIFLESAHFSPLAIAGIARSFGLQTDAAHRFERGVDYEMPHRAMERATALLLDIVGGEAGPITDSIDKLPEYSPVKLRKTRINNLLGVGIPDPEVKAILEGLGLEIAEFTEQGWLVNVPSWRFDISIEEDLIEELARIHGYNNLPVTEPLNRFSLKPAPESRVGLKAIRSLLTANGYQEVVSYSFVNRKLEDSLRLPQNEAIELANPISQDMSVMRSSLWSGLLLTLKHNQNRQQSRVRLFESGLRFVRHNGRLSQNPGIAGLVWGSHRPEQWAVGTSSNDFFDIKGDVESILDLTLDSAAFTFSAAGHPALQPGQSAEILRGDSPVGWVGALNPALQRQLDIPGKAFLFELDLAGISKARLPVAEELSRYPQVRRDLALMVDAGLEFAEMERVIRENAGEHLQDLVVFDLYQGENIEKSKKSLALGLTFQHPSRTLNDDEINSIIDSCIKVLEAQFNAELRK